MQILIPIALFGWLPLILIIFSSMPPRRAVIFSFIGAWLFLPYAGYDLPALPDYTKRSATSLGVALATILFRFDRFSQFRPKWFDLPMTIWVTCPMASSLTNNLGAYDGFAASFDYFVSYGLPYLIGRVYFTRIEHIRQVAIGIILGGMIYLPFCWYELRMSPLIHMRVYGFDPRGWGEVVSGGYRPKVFMSCALELAVWMTATSTTAVWIWASGGLKKLWGFPFGWVALALVCTTVYCKVTGGLILLIIGLSLWPLLKFSKSRLPAIGLVLVPVLYIATRSTATWSGAEAVELVRTVFNERRAASLQYRMLCENLLVAKALQKPAFGWGGWGGARVYNQGGMNIVYTDGMWVIALGNNGLVGLASFNAALLLPMILLIWKCPRRLWQTPEMAPVTVLATVVALYSIDCIANAMLNPIYYLVLGGLTGFLGTFDPKKAFHPVPSQHHDNLASPHVLRSLAVDSRGARQAADADPREEAAARLAALGRALMDHGRTREAEEAWHSALQHWADLVADHPDDPAYRECWLDGLNDAAWSLVAVPGRGIEDLSWALQLAEQAVELEPRKATYWNTLGIAYFRAAEWKSAIHALERSSELNSGGTSFDYFFLAMAHRQLGDRDAALHWNGLANLWMNEHKPDHEDLQRFREEARALIDASTLHASRA